MQIAQPPAQASSSLPPDNPVWSYETKPNKSVNNLRIVGSVVVGQAEDGVFGLDMQTGRQLWRVAGVAGTSIMGQSLFVASGQVPAGNCAPQAYCVYFTQAERLNVLDGAVVWQTARLCPQEESNPKDTGRVTKVEAVDGDVFVGCSYSERLIRLDARTGSVGAVNSSLGVGDISAVTALGPQTIAVETWTSGAILTEFVDLLRRKDLHALPPRRRDTRVLGVVGATAILHEMPGYWSGRTLIFVHLPDGDSLAPLELRPDLNKFPVNRYFTGNGSSAAVIGSRLYLSIAPMLWDYGDARAPAAKPQPLMRSLSQPAMFLGNGYAMVRQRGQNGAEKDQLIDVRSKPVRLHWESDAAVLRIAPWGKTVIYYDALMAPEVIRISGTEGIEGTVFVRVTDGAEIALQASCIQFASKADVLVGACYTATSDGLKMAVERFSFARRN